MADGNATFQDERFRPFQGFDGLPVPPILQQIIAPFAYQGAQRMGMMPFGLSNQNYFDRIDQMRLSDMYGQMMRRAAENDRTTYMAQLQGLSAMTGTPWDAQTRRAANSVADRMVSAGPLMAMLAPETLDAMGGFRGSSAVMAEYAFQGARMRMDPVTGAIGMGQRSLDSMLAAMNNRLAYDKEGGNITSLSLGETGRLFQTLQRSGLIRATSLRDVPNDALQTAAKDLGIDLSKGLGGLDANQISKLTASLGPQLQQIDSGRVTDTLRRYQGAISAVREIFGDAGRPNAPMAELLQALNGLSGGGLGQIDPSRLNQMVRTTYDLARRSGLGVPNVIAFQDQLAHQARAMGLPTPFSATATQQALAFGQAFQAVGYGATPVWGQGNLDFQRALFAQQQMAAAASPMANQIGLMERLNQLSGGTAFKAGSRAAKYMEAIKSGAGVDPMSDAQFLDMAAEGAAPAFADRARLMEMLSQEDTNRQYGFTVNADRMARIGQRREMSVFLERSSRHTVVREARRRGMDAATADLVADQASKSYAKALSEMSPEQYGDPTKRSEILARELRNSLGGTAEGQEFLRRMPAEALSSMASSMFGTSEQSMRGFGLGHYGSLVNMLTQNNPELFNAMERARGAAEGRARLRTALAPFGRRGLLANAMQALTETKPDDPDKVAKVFLRSLGVVDRDDLTATIREPLAKIQSDAKEYMDLLEVQQQTGNLTPEQKARMESALKGITDVVNDQLIPKLDKNQLLYRTNVRPDEFALYGRQTAALRDFRADGGDKNRALGIARSQQRGLESTIEALTFDPTAMLQFGPEGEKQLNLLRQSQTTLARLAKDRDLSVVEVLADPNATAAEREAMTTQEKAMAWFHQALSGAKGGEKPWAWLDRKVGGVFATADAVKDLKDKAGNKFSSLQSLDQILTMNEQDWRSVRDAAGMSTAQIKTLEDARGAFATEKLRITSDQASRAEKLKDSLSSAYGIITGEEAPDDVLSLLPPGVKKMLQEQPALSRQVIDRASELEQARGLQRAGREKEAFDLLKKSGIENLLPSATKEGGLDKGDLLDLLKSIPEVKAAMDQEQASKELDVTIQVARVEMDGEGMTLKGTGAMMGKTRSFV